jgi:hypothetical protein
MCLSIVGLCCDHFGVGWTFLGWFEYQRCPSHKNFETLTHHQFDARYGRSHQDAVDILALDGEHHDIVLSVYDRGSYSWRLIILRSIFVQMCADHHFTS